MRGKTSCWKSSFGSQRVRCVLLFAHGPIDSFALVSDQHSCQPHGFGFIEVSNADAACARH